MQGTREAGRDPTSEQQSIDARHFFDFYDEEFLYEVYAKLLNRLPDPTGAAHYLSSIRAGESRYRILESFARSAEAREKGVELRGMSGYRFMKVVKAIPIIGRIVQAAIFLWRIDALMKDLRAMENHMYRISTKVTGL